MPSLVNHGTPVISSRQWTTGIAPNPANNGWNYIVQSYNYAGRAPVAEWIVISDLTGTPSAPSQATYDQTAPCYANSNFQYTNQLRAGNGRIFFWCNQNKIAYYEPTTAEMNFIGPFVENPPINPNASTAPFSASFDVGGMLYGATQESQNRPSAVFSVNPTTLAITVLGYVGSNATGYTTYGYYIAPDTATATQHIYVAFGEAPWQLWDLNLTTSVATLLYQPSGTAPFISFTNISGQGWVANIHTDLGKPDDVLTQLWCLDGATYPYTQGVPPPDSLARNVTPASNPVVGAPELDTGGGIGVVGWRAGSSGPYDYIDYTVVYESPQPIESLTTTPTGVLGNAAGYQGWINVTDATDTIEWYGAQAAMGISEGPRLTVSATQIYATGYPNGVLFQYDSTQAWQASSTPTVNPLLLGYYGPSGNQLAGIKYANQFAWSPSAGTSGRLFCYGLRDRTGTGSGFGSYDVSTKAFAGTFASPLDQAQPQGLVALEGPGWIVLSTNTLSDTGTASLFVYDHSLNLVSTQAPLSGIASLGAGTINTTAALQSLFPTNNADVVTGIYLVAGALALWQWNVSTQTLVANPTTAFTGTVGATTINQADGSIWLTIGDTLVRVDPNTLATTNELDLTSIAPTPTAMAFYGTDLWLNGTEGSNPAGSSLLSVEFTQTDYTITADGGTVTITGTSATFSTGPANVIAADGGAVAITGCATTFIYSLSMTANGGLVTIDGTSIKLILGTVGGLLNDMGTILKNIVAFTSGGPTTLPHELNLNGVPVVPRLIIPNELGFTITADNMNVTISPSGNVNIYVEQWHTTVDVEPPGGLGAFFPFIATSGNSTTLVVVTGTYLPGQIIGAAGSVNGITTGELIDAATGLSCIGLAQTGGNGDTATTAQFRDVFTQSIAAWNLIIDNGGPSGLTVGPYWASQTTPGNITSTPPTAGETAIPIGTALSNTRFLIQISAPYIVA